MCKFREGSTFGSALFLGQFPNPDTDLQRYQTGKSDPDPDRHFLKLKRCRSTTLNTEHLQYSTRTYDNAVPLLQKNLFKT